MIYLFGSIGFIGGFVVGQMILAFLLRHKTTQELKTDPTLKVYGLLNWVVAVLGAMSVVALYGKYYG